MKIDKIFLHHLRMPLRAPFETSFGLVNQRECILIILHADGILGYGECVADGFPGYSYETTGTAWHILKDFLAPMILRQEIIDPPGLQERIMEIRGHHLAKAGVEMALWDLYGKQNGKSLKQLLGGTRDRVEVGVSIGLQDTEEALVRQTARYLEEGYQRIKIKIKPGRDVGDATAVRRAFSKIKLQVDANSAYTPETAESLMPLDDLNLLMIEQPLSEDDIWDHSKLQKRFTTSICLDESIVSARHARYAIEMKACRIINIKAGRLGGLSQAVRVHDLCKQVTMPVWCGGMLETGVGRASNLALASLPNFSLPGDISASDRYYERDITEERFNLNPDSTIDVPSSHGLGVTLDRKALIEFTLRQHIIKTDQG